MTVGLALGLAGGCGSTATASPSATPTTTTAAQRRDPHGGTSNSMAGMNGMNGMSEMDGMGSMDGSMSGQHHGMEFPPLASRLAAATTAERAAAADLLARTRATLQAYDSEPAARAAGFEPNPNGGRLIHYRNVANRRDDRQLEPEHLEGLVYVRTVAGTLQLLGAVYTVHAGETAPTPGGAIFQWHTHDSTCPTFLVAPGACQDTFRMLHVWTTSAATVVDPWNQSARAAFGRS